MAWETWGPAAFERALSARKPVFLDLHSRWSSLSRTLGEVYSEGDLRRILTEGFVPVRVDRDLRPDIAARYGRSGNAAAVLSGNGDLIENPSFVSAQQLAETLLRVSSRYRPDDKAPEPAAKPVWTGAVGPAGKTELDPQWPARVLSEIKAVGGPLACPNCLEYLLFAGVDLKDAEARAQFLARLSEIAQGPMWDSKAGGFSRSGEEKHLGLNARLARLYWDAYSLTGLELFREAAHKTQSFLMRDLYDPSVGAFRNSTRSRDVFYTDTNAMVVLALLKSAAFSGGERSLAIAKQTIAFLTKQYDTGRGMGHASAETGEVFGLLGANAWMMLALTESFLVTGSRPLRELANAIL